MFRPSQGFRGSHQGTQGSVDGQGQGSGDRATQQETLGGGEQLAQSSGSAWKESPKIPRQNTRSDGEMQQNTWRQAILASHTTAKNTVEGGHGALALERKVRKTYYSRPTAVEVKYLTHFKIIPKSCHHNIYIMIRKCTTIKCQRVQSTRKQRLKAKVWVIQGENEKTERRLHGEGIKITF